MRFCLIFLVLLVLNACKELEKSLPAIPASRLDSMSTDQTRTNHHVGELEIQDRSLWQRPYEIMEMLGPLEDQVVADIGAGSGYFAFRFIHKARKVIAVDIEQELIDLMNAEKMYYMPEIQARFEARLATESDPQLQDQEVDVVFMSNTYGYLKNRIFYLKNLKNKLRAGGRIMIVDFKKKLTPFGPPMEQRMAQGDVESELIAAGYRILISDDEKLKYQYVIVAQ